MANTMESSVARMTIRRVTSRWEVSWGPTGCPATVGPKSPWMAWENQIQYRSHSGSFRWSSFSRCTMVACGILGLACRRASGLPDSATRRKTRIVARNSTTMLMSNRRMT